MKHHSYRNKFSLKNKACSYIKIKSIPQNESWSRLLKKFMFTYAINNVYLFIFNLKCIFSAGNKTLSVN